MPANAKITPLYVFLMCLLFSACSVSVGHSGNGFNHAHPIVKPMPRLTGERLKPLVIEPPCYPARAAIMQTEGWVQLEFNLDAKGQPQSIETVDAWPEDVFVECALSALRSWRFQRPQAAKLATRYQFIFQFRLDQ